MKKIIICLLPLFFFSCQKGNVYNLEKAMYYAGENASELKKVLKHYSSNKSDSLKLKAAEFLIANMRGHFSCNNREILESYCDEIEKSASINNSSEENRAVIEQISKQYENTNNLNEYITDLKIITAEYLIHNIESAFEVWEKGEWATHVSFSDFCEYILPYKVAEFQLLDHWRDYSKNLFAGDLDNLHYCDLYKNSVFQAATTVSKEIIKSNRQDWPFGGINAFPILKISTLAQMPFGSCSDYSTLALAVMRSKGIPVAEDFTPQWPFQAQGHTWNVLLDNNFKHLIFSSGSSNPGEVHKPTEKMAKVFRKCYAVNEEILAIRSSEKRVPTLYNNCCFKDVTDEYMDVRDIEITIPSKFRKKFKYAYLAVFDNKNWTPIHYGKVSGKKVKFEKMGKNCMYLPVFYNEQGIVPFSSPFLLTAKGEIKKFVGDFNNFQTMVVRRKYFVGSHIYDVERMKNGLFQAANNSDFSDADTLYRIPEFTVQSGEVFLDTLQKSYRYWRYVGPDYSFCNVGELYFYQDRNKKPIYGQVIGTQEINPINKKEVTFDGDPLTLFNSAEPVGGWVGLDFGKPVKIDKISYTPRGDGNDITPGNIYELFFWANNQWNSAGKKEAYDIKLIYDNIPVNTIYWIHNHSGGNDERIFTYENGKQIWW
jgi:hypothetical protein